jgi:PAS domain-containing protein
MVNTCESFAREYGMLYNSTKSACMLFTKKNGAEIMNNVTLEGNNLDWVSSIKHLGNYLSSNLSEMKEIQMKRGDLIGRVNVILANVRGAPDDVMSVIFSSQCHLYGCQAWNYTDPSTDNMYTMWNRSARRLLGLPQQTHTRYLSHLLDVPHAKVQVFRRFTKMVKNMIASDNRIVNFIAKLGIYHADTIIGANIRYIQRATGVSDILQGHVPSDIYPCSDEDMSIIETIKELKRDIIPFLHNYEQHELLCYLCTN